MYIKSAYSTLIKKPVSNNMDFNTFFDRSKLFAIEASSNHLVGTVDIDIKNFITTSVHCKKFNNKEQATDEGIQSPGTKMIESFHQH